MQSRVNPMFPYQKVDSTSFKRSPKTTQAFQSSNYPGLCRVSGRELQKVLQEQVGTMGLEIYEERIERNLRRAVWENVVRPPFDYYQQNAAKELNSRFFITLWLPQAIAFWRMVVLNLDRTVLRYCNGIVR